MDLLALTIPVATRARAREAMLDRSLAHLVLDATRRRTNRAELGQDVAAAAGTRPAIGFAGTPRIMTRSGVRPATWSTHPQRGTRRKASRPIHDTAVGVVRVPQRDDLEGTVPSSAGRIVTALYRPAGF